MYWDRRIIQRVVLLLPPLLYAREQFILFFISVQLSQCKEKKIPHFEIFSWISHTFYKQDSSKINEKCKKYWKKSKYRIWWAERKTSSKTHVLLLFFFLLLLLKISILFYFLFYFFNFFIEYLKINTHVMTDDIDKIYFSKILIRNFRI